MKDFEPLRQILLERQLIKNASTLLSASYNYIDFNCESIDIADWVIWIPGKNIKQDMPDYQNLIFFLRKRGKLKEVSAHQALSSNVMPKEIKQVFVYNIEYLNE